jgi:hypothetical protein
MLLIGLCQGRGKAEAGEVVYNYRLLQKTFQTSFKPSLQTVDNSSSFFIYSTFYGQRGISYRLVVGVLLSYEAITQHTTTA